MVWLAIAAFAAGLVDAVAGGGGLIQVPALFVAYPMAAPAVLLGTNKLASIVGTFGAAVRYVRALRTPPTILVAVALAAFLASVAGAIAVLHMPVEPLRQALPFVLAGVLIFTLSGDLGLTHTPRQGVVSPGATAATGSAAIGFYDGFLGPGAGAFYKVAFMRGLGYDFLNAAAPAKVANVASNLGALLVFLSFGAILWDIALVMAVANFAGGQVGARAALRHGSGFIRRVFILVVLALVAKTFHDAYLL